MFKKNKKIELIIPILFIASIISLNVQAKAEQNESLVTIRNIQVKSVRESSATIELTYQYRGKDKDRRIGIEVVAPSSLVEKYRLDERNFSMPFPRYSFPVTPGIHKLSFPAIRESYVPEAYVTHQLRLAEVIQDLRSRKPPIVLTPKLYPLEIH